MGLGTHGVALGTVGAQYSGLALALGLMQWKYRPIVQKIQTAALLKWSALERFMRVNNNIFLRTICLTLAFALFYRQSAAEGALILAANTVLMQFLNWMSYGVDGFAYAAESLVGRFKGAKNNVELSKSIKLPFCWRMLFAALYTLT